MVAANVPIAALAAGVRKAILGKCGNDGNGKSSPGVNAGGVGPVDGGVGFGLLGGVVSPSVISSPRTRYQLLLTGVTLEPSPWSKVPKGSTVGFAVEACAEIGCCNHQQRLIYRKI